MEELDRQNLLYGQVDEYQVPCGEGRTIRCTKSPNSECSATNESCVDDPAEWLEEVCGCDPDLPKMEIEEVVTAVLKRGQLVRYPSSLVDPSQAENPRVIWWTAWFERMEPCGGGNAINTRVLTHIGLEIGPLRIWLEVPPLPKHERVLVAWHDEEPLS